MSVADKYDGLVGIGERGVHQVTYIAFIIALCPFVDLIKRKEGCFLTSLDINGMARFHIGLNQLVSPPCQPYVLGLHVVIVRTAEVQILEGE